MPLDRSVCVSVCVRFFGRSPSERKRLRPRVSTGELSELNNAFLLLKWVHIAEHVNRIVVADAQT